MSGYDWDENGGERTPTQLYNPARLLDILIENLNVKNDAGLSRALEISPPALSKIRHGRVPISPSTLIRMHEVTGLSIRDLRFLMGDRDEKFRSAGAHGNLNVSTEHTEDEINRL